MMGPSVSYHAFVHQRDCQVVSPNSCKDLRKFSLSFLLNLAIPYHSQCVDFVSGVSVEFRNAYHVFFVAFQFVLPTVGTVVCYALLIREVTSMVKNEESKSRQP